MSKSTFVQHLKKFTQIVSEISHLKEWNGQMNGWMEGGMDRQMDDPKI